MPPWNVSSSTGAQYSGPVSYMSKTVKSNRAKSMGDRSKRWPDRSAPSSNIRPSATNILLSRLIELLLSSLHVLSHPCHGVLLRRIHIASTCVAWAPTRSAPWIELRYRCGRELLQVSGRCDVQTLATVGLSVNIPCHALLTTHAFLANMPRALMSDQKSEQWPRGKCVRINTVRCTGGGIFALSFWSTWQNNHRFSEVHQ